jgi:phytoene/squalene synthetase
VPALVGLVRDAGCALQLVNDIYNVAEDAAGGRSTPLLRWLAAEGVDTASPRLRARVIESRAFARSLDEARRFAARAAARARELELLRVGEVAGRVGAMVDAAPERMFRVALGGTV